MSNITEFADIPEYSVTGNLTLQGARDLVMDIYTENYKKVYAKAPPLYDSDPLTLTLKSMAMLYYMAMQVAERRALAAMLKSAEGAQLDNIGLPFGVKRNPATYATVTIRFTLSAAQKSVAMIPQGTRIRTGAGIYFATTEYAQIDIGETSVDVLAKAEEVGAESNDIPPGVIDTLVDAIPFVAGAVNIDTSSGGADVESDDSLTRRIWLSPTTYSCAGPRDAYEFWAMSFRSDIENAIAISPRSQPCTAYIYFMLTGGKMPSEKDISEMETFMMNEARRPMTDLVICKAPEEVEYSIDFTYYIGASSKKNADIVQQNVAQAVQEYQDWQRSIGRDINPMELIYRLRAAGVKRVEMREPAFKVVESVLRKLCSNLSVKEQLLTLIYAIKELQTRYFRKNGLYEETQKQIDDVIKIFAAIITESNISDVIGNDDLFKTLHTLSTQNVEDVCKIYDTLVKRGVITNTVAGKYLMELVTEPYKNGVENKKSFYDQIKTIKNSLIILSYIHELDTGSFKTVMKRFKNYEFEFTKPLYSATLKEQNYNLWKNHIDFLGCLVYIELCAQKNYQHKLSKAVNEYKMISSNYSKILMKYSTVYQVIVNELSASKL